MYNDLKVAGKICELVDEMVNQLIYTDFSQDTIDQYTQIIKMSLSKQNKNNIFFRLTLYDKIKCAAKIINETDTGKYVTFRKLIKTLMVLNISDFSYFETYFLNKRDIELFLILLEEKVAAHQDISKLEDSFISIIKMEGINLSEINSFLKILGKDRLWLTEKLIQFLEFEALKLQIYGLIQTENFSELDKTISCIIEHSKDILAYNKNTYSNIVYSIITNCNKYTKELLLPPEIERSLYKIFISNSHAVSAAVNFSLYLYDKGPNYYYEFEKDYIKHFSLGYSLLEFTKQLPFSSKRLILSKLIELKEEGTLISFIKEYPQYKNLLPML